MENKKVNLNEVEKNALNEIDIKLFARIAYIVEKYGVDVPGIERKKIVSIPFDAYDSLERAVRLSDAPSIYNQDIMNKLKLVRILEAFKKETILSMSEYMEGFVNPKCMNYKISTREDSSNKSVIVELKL